jgi:hypothetical protein
MQPALLLLHGTPVSGRPPHNLAAKGLRSRALAPRLLSKGSCVAGFLQSGRPRDTPSARTLPSHFGGPCSVWDFKTMDGGAYPGVLGPPASEILIKPAAVTGTHVTYPRSDGTRVIPGLGRGGALARGRHMRPLCRSVGLPCVGLLLTILPRKASVLGLTPPGGSVRLGRGWILATGPTAGMTCTVRSPIPRP